MPHLLKFVVVYGFVLKRLCPTDLVVGMDVVQKMIAPRGSAGAQRETEIPPGSAGDNQDTEAPRYSGVKLESEAPRGPEHYPPADGMAAVYIAHSLKWPPAIKHFFRCLESRNRPWTAENLANAVLETVRYCNGKRWREMFKGMNGNTRNHALSGVAVNVANWGAIVNQEPKARATNAGTPASGCSSPATAHSSAMADFSPGTGCSSLAGGCSPLAAGCSSPAAVGSSPDIVHLGPDSTPYKVFENAEALLAVKFAVVLQAATLFKKAWPRSSEDTVAFLQELSDFFLKAREASGSNYLRKNFLRWTVAFMDTAYPMLFDGLAFAQVKDFLPDEREHLDEWFDIELRVMRETYDVSFWELSMWACLLGAKPAEPQVKAALENATPEAAAIWLRDAEFERLSAKDSHNTWPFAGPAVLADWIEIAAQLRPGVVVSGSADT
jgi:hypothetical protein